MRWASRCRSELAVTRAGQWSPDDPELHPRSRPHRQHGRGAEQAFVDRAALGRMVTEEEVAQAVEAMLTLTGLSGADIDLSAGMIAR